MRSNEAIRLLKRHGYSITRGDERKQQIVASKYGVPTIHVDFVNGEVEQVYYRGASAVVPDAYLRHIVKYPF